MNMRKADNEPSYYGNLINEEIETELEGGINQYLRDNITFVCFPVVAERLRLEEGIIASPNRHSSFGPSSNWLGLNSPIPEISSSSLWNRQGLQGQPISDKGLERVKWLTRFGNDSYRNNMERTTHVQRADNSVSMAVKTTGSQMKQLMM